MRLICAALCLFGCSDPSAPVGPPPPDAWLHDVEADAPLWLSHVGLYADLPARVAHEGVVEYTPPHPLWSSGAAKERLAWIPGDVGAALDFPPGTVFAKTFVLDDAIETRLLFRRAGAWHFALYHWGSNGTDARRMPAHWAAQVIELPGPFRYTLPGELECRACHETAAESPVLAASGWNLDPALGLGDAQPLPARDPAEAAAMGYLVGNCVHCHHGEGGGENASYSLMPGDLVENTVGRPTEGSASGVALRVAPGSPDTSAVYLALTAAEGDIKPMPPLGIDRLDTTGAEVIRRWIESLR